MENNKNSGSKNFECTICLDTAKEPVLTKCGHMFCWPCIYNWLDSKGGRAKCPNCKNEITKNDLIPVYANDENQENTNRFKNIPKRPKAERNPNSDRENYQGGFSNFSENELQIVKNIFNICLEFLNTESDFNFETQCFKDLF